MTDPTTPPEPRAEPEYPHYENRRRVEAYIREHRTPPEPVGARGLTAEEAVEKALLYVFQLSGKDYRKMQRSLSESAFIRALEQDGYTVAALRADTARVPDQSDPIETFSHPYRAPVVIDGHEYLHTSDCEWPALATSPLEVSDD